MRSGAKVSDLRLQQLIVYYTIYGMLLLFAKAARRGAPYFTSLLGLIAFAGFRYDVGCDFSGYLYNWNMMAGQTLKSATLLTEPAHWAMIVLLRQAGLDYTYLLVSAAIIFFVGFHALAKRQPNPMAMLALAFPILIIGMPMSGIRQAEAIGIMCLAYNAFVDKRIVRFVLLVGLATLFHQSAMVFVALAPLIPIQLNKRNVALAVLLALPGLYLMSHSAASQEATSRYIDTGTDAAGAAFRLLLLVLSGLLYLWKLRPKWQREFPEDCKLVTIGAWLMVALFGLFFVSSVIGDRFGYYLIPLQLMIFVRLPYIQGLKNRKTWTLLPYAGMTLVFLVWTQLSWHFQQCYIPYQMGIYHAD